MRAFDNGAYYSVSIARDEVAAFKVQWPCSGLPTVPVAFQFEKRTGDLVDIMPYRVASRFDGAAALALSQDAQAYGRKRLGLTD